jgi:hypothetical protein
MPVQEQGTCHALASPRNCMMYLEFTAKTHCDATHTVKPRRKFDGGIARHPELPFL